MSKYTKLTPAEWEKAKQVYISTVIGLNQLAKDFNISYHTVRKRYSENSWARLREDFFQKEKVTISDDAINRSVDKAREIDKEHQHTSGDAVKVARALLASVANEMRGGITKDGKKIEPIIDPLAVQRSISALSTALHMDRVTHNLPTTFNRTDVTTKGESFNQQVDGIFKDETLLKIAKDNNIDVRHITRLARRVVDDADNQG